MKNKILVFFFILLFTGCGFTPMYNNFSKLDYNISINEKKGDRFINNIMSNEIQRISNSDSKNQLNIKIDTKFEKIVVTKDTKGSVSEYKLNAKTIVVLENLKNKSLEFNESQNLKNISDVFQQKNYENTIKRNFAFSIVRKFNLSLIDLK
jgi:outer membrane lipopolysaccharide assembly protein LptE/RlpB